MKKEKKELGNSIVKIVKDSIEAHARTNGHLTHQSVTNIIEQNQKVIDEKIQSHNSKLLNDIRSVIQGQQSHQQQQAHTTIQPPPPPSDSIRTHQYFYQCDGLSMYWNVPKGFQFPKGCKRKEAWTFWIRGMPNYATEDGTASPVMPFRKMKIKGLPKKLRGQWKAQWHPVLSKMASAPELKQFNADGWANTNRISIGSNRVSIDDIEKTYEVGSNFLKNSVCEYVWLNYASTHNEWTVGTWSKRVQYQEIMKRGTDNDKMNLPNETKMNKKRKCN